MFRSTPLSTSSLLKFLPFHRFQWDRRLCLGLPRAGAYDHGGKHSLDAFERQSRKSHRGHRGWMVGWWKPCESCGVWWCMALMWPLPLESSYFLLDLGGTWKVFAGSSPRGNFSLHELRSLVLEGFFSRDFFGSRHSWESQVSDLYKDARWWQLKYFLFSALFGEDVQFH